MKSLALVLALFVCSCDLSSNSDNKENNRIEFPEITYEPLCCLNSGKTVVTFYNDSVEFIRTRSMVSAVCDLNGTLSVSSCDYVRSFRYSGKSYIITQFDNDYVLMER